MQAYPATFAGCPHAADKEPGRSCERPGMAQPRGAIRPAGRGASASPVHPIEANGAALLFGLLRTGVLRNVEIAAAERTQSRRPPFEIPAVDAGPISLAGTSGAPRPSVGRIESLQKFPCGAGLPPSITKSE